MADPIIIAPSTGDTSGSTGPEPIPPPPGQPDTPERFGGPFPTTPVDAGGASRRGRDFVRGRTDHASSQIEQFFRRGDVPIGQRVVDGETPVEFSAASGIDRALSKLDGENGRGRAAVSSAAEASSGRAVGPIAGPLARPGKIFQEFGELFRGERTEVSEDVGRSVLSAGSALVLFLTLGG